MPPPIVNYSYPLIFLRFVFFYSNQRCCRRLNYCTKHIFVPPFSSSQRKDFFLLLLHIKVAILLHCLYKPSRILIFFLKLCGRIFVSWLFLTYVECKREDRGWRSASWFTYKCRKGGGKPISDWDYGQSIRGCFLCADYMVISLNSLFFRLVVVCREGNRTSGSFLGPEATLTAP